MRASLTVPVPANWRCYWAWGSPRCSVSRVNQVDWRSNRLSSNSSAGAANSPVTVMASIAAKAATAMWRIASARRNARVSC
jgi:hypothetical protein